MIHILDYKTEKIVGTLENKEETSLFWEDNHKQSLQDNLETFNFTMQADVKESEFVSKRNRIIIPDEDGFFREFIIFEAKQYSDLTKEVYTNGSYSDLKKQKIIEPTTLDNQTISNAGQFVLSDTSYQLGIIEISGTRKIVFENYTDALSALQIIASAFDCELRFRVEVKGNRIIGRYVDFLQQVGGNNGKEIELGKDLIGITRKENTDEIVTALIVLGPEKEDGTRAIVTVKDEDALQRWADKDNRHLWDVYEPQVDQDVTEQRLTELGRNELNKRINSLVEYTADTASIEYIFGYEHEKVRLGDTTRIKDTSFEPALYVEARVIEVDRSISDPSSKSYVLGDFIEYSEEDIMARFRKLQGILQQKVSAGEITAIREYVDQQDQANYEDSTHYADVVSETAKNNAVNESINYIDNQVSQVEETIEQVEQEVRQRELQVYKQDTAPTGTDFIIGQLWIRTTDNAFHKWDGAKWVKFLPTIQELADKAGLEYVNGELRSKADKADTYTKTEVNNALNGKVSTTTYTTDMNGVVQNLSNLETKVSQTEKAINFLATKDELNAITDEIESINSELSIQAGKIESAVTKTELENLTIGGRNLASKQQVTSTGTAFTYSDYKYTIDEKTGVGGTGLKLSKDMFKPNTNYVLSFKVKKLSGSITTIAGHSLLFLNNTTTKVYRDGVLISNNWSSGLGVNPYPDDTVEHQYVVYFRTGLMDGTTSDYNLYIQPNRSHYAKPYKAEIWELQVEEGDKKTGWTPAPEDVDASISSLGTKISDAESRITQTEKDITSKVSTTTYTTEVGGLKNRMDTAESTISQHSTNINLKVDKNGVISAINISPESVKIEAKKLLVGDFTNLCENPDFEGDTVNTMPRGYNGSSGYVMDISNFTAGNGSNKALAINARNNGNADVYGNNLIPVVEGDEFYVEFEGRFYNTLGNKVMGVGFRRYDQKGVGLSSWIRVATLTNATTFTKAKGTYKVPAGTGYLQLFITFPNNNETTNIALFDNIKIHRRNTADLIVNGSITADHIKSLNGLDVGNGQFVVDANGNVSFKGNLNGATGTFSGTLSTSGASGKVNISGDTIKSISSGSIVESAELSMGQFVAYTNGSTWETASKKIQIHTNGMFFVRSDSDVSYNYDGIYSSREFTIRPRTVFPNGIAPLAHSTLPLTNGWTHYDTVNYIGASYTKSVDGFVHLRGMVSGGAVGTVIGVLPVGCRPLRTEPIIVLTSSGFGRVDILENGYIKLVSGGTGWVSLSSIVFLAEN